MKLTGLRLRQLRQFRTQLEIREFSPGLNLFSGPNESGKSTIIRAIRAAFFERYRSGVIEDLIPRGEQPSTSSPTVEVEFDVAAGHCVLSKTFFSKKRCLLTADNASFDGEQAEEHLAQVLGFGYAAKGASKPDHWGIPGLLWIQQGEGHLVHDAVSHATDHLRTALESTLGAVASTGGDDVLASLRAKRDALLTAKGGLPKGQFAEVVKDLADATLQIASLDARIATYRDDVDRLSSLRSQHEADRTNKPWEKFNLLLEDARSRLATANQFRDALVRERQSLAQHEQSVLLLSQQIQNAEDRRGLLVRRQAEQSTAAAALETAQAVLSGWDAKKVAATQAHEAAGALVALAEQEERRAGLVAQITSANKAVVALESRVVDGEAESLRLHEHTAAVVRHQISESDVARLRTQTDALRDLKITQHAASTKLAFNFTDGVAVLLNGESIQPAGEHRITAAADVSIAGIGVLRITPGANDVGDISSQIRNAESVVLASLNRLGAASLDAAALTLERLKQAKTDLETSNRLLKNIAPKGMDSLRAELAEATATQVQAQAALDALPAVPTFPAPSVADAKGVLAAARSTLDETTQLHAHAVTQHATARSEATSAQREASELQAAVEDPENVRRHSEVAAQLLESRARDSLSRSSIAALELQIVQSRPELIEQDVARYSASAEQATKTFNDRDGQVKNLEGRLDADGTSGMEEQRAEVEIRAQALRRRHAELSLRAKALDLLVTRLEAKRHALTRRLQAPLQRRLAHYVQILFPNGVLDLNENLSPGDLTRTGSRGTEVSSFAELSFGAQEQTGLVSRLAYADLLKEAGKPTLIILDDALVHSDDNRLEQMKRVIFDAARRHQVLLFTCHPDRWGGIGVAPRPIASFVS